MQGELLQQRLGMVWTTRHAVLHNDGLLLVFRSKSDWKCQRQPKWVVRCQDSCILIVNGKDNSRFTLEQQGVSHDIRVATTRGGYTRGEWAHAVLTHIVTGKEQKRAHDKQEACKQGSQREERISWTEGQRRRRMEQTPSEAPLTEQYIMMETDTIEGIAMAYGVSPAWLKRHNRGSFFCTGDAIQVPLRRGEQDADLKNACTQDDISLREPRVSIDSCYTDDYTENSDESDDSEEDTEESEESEESEDGTE